MVADVPAFRQERESLLAAIARQAASASRNTLWALAAVAALGIVASMVTARHWTVMAWVASAISLAALCLALWELCRRSRVLPARVRAILQWTLLAVGMSSWFLGGVAALLALLGDPWKL